MAAVGIACALPVISPSAAARSRSFFRYHSRMSARCCSISARRAATCLAFAAELFGLLGQVLRGRIHLLSRPDRPRLASRRAAIRCASALASSRRPVPCHSINCWRNAVTASRCSALARLSVSSCSRGGRLLREPARGRRRGLAAEAGEVVEFGEVPAEHVAGRPRGVRARSGLVLEFRRLLAKRWRCRRRPGRGRRPVLPASRVRFCDAARSASHFARMSASALRSAATAAPTSFSLATCRARPAPSRRSRRPALDSARAVPRLAACVRRVGRRSSAARPRPRNGACSTAARSAASCRAISSSALARAARSSARRRSCS